MSRSFWIVFLLWALGPADLFSQTADGAGDSLRYRSPLCVVVSRDGGRLYVTCRESDALLVVDLASGQVAHEVPVGRSPYWAAEHPDGRSLWVSNRWGHSVSEVDAGTFRVTRTVGVGFEPCGLAFNREGTVLYVADSGSGAVSVVDARRGAEVKRLTAGRSPVFLALTPDGRRLYVTNLLSRPVPYGAPPEPEVTVIDAERQVVSERLSLASASSVAGIAWSPGGDVGLIALLRPKNLVTATQVAQGWMITNGLGVVRPGAKDPVAQVLLDEMNAYFADPFGVAFSPDGGEAYVTTSGANSVSVVDVGRLKALLDRASSGDLTRRYPNDLGLSADYVAARIPVGNAPKGIAVSPDGRTVYVAEQLTDRIAVIDARLRRVTGWIDLGGPGVLTLRRRGEQLFNGVTATFQGQFSCQSCHPDGGVDGLSYDLEPDGLGASLVDNRTLRGIAGTGPFKWSGVTPDLKTQCGMRFARFITRSGGFSPEELEALVAYLKTIPLSPNPHRSPDGRLTPAQARGRRIFERTATNDGRPIPPEGRCVTCHPPPFYTNGRSFDVGTRKGYDTSGAFDTPQLNHIHDTAPYLHDGSAATLEEIWTVYGTEDRHGVVNDLTKEQLNDLIEYLKSL
jgi:YVTN family beta-propeller protein